VVPIKGSSNNLIQGYFEELIVVPPQFQFEELLRDILGTFTF
jgi:hypothetical protein